LEKIFPFFGKNFFAAFARTFALFLQTVCMDEKGRVHKKSNSFLTGAALIAAGGLIAKLVGALYRIPLLSLIGGRGIGLYQLVYPVYCILLTVSATGIPSSIAKLVAERVEKGKSPQGVFRSSLRLFVLVGLAGTAVMVIAAPLLSRAQGSEEVRAGYYTLAPAVVLVSALSVFRGYFQGTNRMFPTALSEIVEQVVKVGFGLFFAYLYRDNLRVAVTLLLLAVTISEAVALLVTFLQYRRDKLRKEYADDGGMYATKSILKLSIPVTLSSVLLPLSSLIDSVLVVRLMGKYASDAVTLYGLFAGGAVTVINLPVSVCYGIAAASIPAVAAAKAKTGDMTDRVRRASVRRRWLYSLIVTVAIAAPSAIGLYFFAQPAAKLIFRNLRGEELKILVELVKIFSVSALTLSCVQTLSACLTAQGKPKYAAISMGVGIIVKTVVYCVLLQNPKISVFGLAHATNLCYLVAFLLDLLYNFRVK